MDNDCRVLGSPPMSCTEEPHSLLAVYADELEGWGALESDGFCLELSGQMQDTNQIGISFKQRIAFWCKCILCNIWDMNFF